MPIGCSPWITRGLSSDTVQTRPFQESKVWPRQKSGDDARTRITSVSSGRPRSDVSSCFENPKYPKDARGVFDCGSPEAEGSSEPSDGLESSPPERIGVS